MIEVVSPGPLTTVQDLGRPGAGVLGIPESGAMDRAAARIANRLVGNDDGAAVLECTIVGPTLRFLHRARVALTGARATCKLDGDQIPYGRSVDVETGAILSIGRTLEGARGYVGIAGGIDVAPVLGSRSRHVSAGLGPEALRTGTRLPVGDGAPGPHRRIRDGALQAYARAITVRFVRGPQWADFTGEAHDAFRSTPFTVGTTSNRAGVRLDGPALRARAHDIDPEGVVLGAVQVPGNGLPIVLGPDRPITGGYPKIAVVVSADLGMLAQAKPGDTLRFVETTIADARAARAEHERALDAAIEEQP